MNTKAVRILYLVAGILLLISAWLGKSYVLVSIGSLFVVLSIVFGKLVKSKANDKKEDDEKKVCFKR